MADNSSFTSPLWGEKRVIKFADEALRTAPDFTAADKAYSRLMSNPTLFARGGSFVDPMQAQQFAGKGFLQSRGQTEGDFLQNQNRLAQVSAGAGSSLANIVSDISSLNALQTSGQGGLYGQLMGGLL